MYEGDICCCRISDWKAKSWSDSQHNSEEEWVEIGGFIRYHFSEGNEVKISLSASASIDSFLKGHSRTTAKDIIDLMFNNSASAKKVRNKNTPAGKERIEIRNAGSTRGARSRGTSWQTSAGTIDVATIIYDIYI